MSYATDPPISGTPSTFDWATTRTAIYRAVLTTYNDVRDSFNRMVPEKHGIDIHSERKTKKKAYTQHSERLSDICGAFKSGARGLQGFDTC